MPSSRGHASSSDLLDRPHPGELAGRDRPLILEDPRSRGILDDVRRVAPSEATVLIVGETGTGKEIVARHLHELSPRARGPFVAVNCGALTESLVESELFGHEKGAFTGAVSSTPGWFEVAAGGTLFLDEVGDLPLGVQVKLLRVLQEREVIRVGSRRPRPIDVRLVAATNVDLSAAMAAGKFRRDLYFRLSVMTLDLPALRERPADIEALAVHFLRIYGEPCGKRGLLLDPAALHRLLRHPWPGNVRELENVIHRAVLTCPGGAVEAGDLRLTAAPPPAAEQRWRPAPHPGQALERILEEMFESGGPGTFQQIESTVVLAAYRHCRENQVHAARLLGVTRNVLRSRLARLGIIAGRADRAPAVPRGGLSSRGAGLKLDA